MDTELESMLDRADELVVDLEGEYKKCLQLQNVTERAKNLTHEVLEKRDIHLTTQCILFGKST